MLELKLLVPCLQIMSNFDKSLVQHGIFSYNFRIKNLRDLVDHQVNIRLENIVSEIEDPAGSISSRRAKLIPLISIFLENPYQVIEHNL